jgi:FkbM family methyltransferase
LGRLINQTANRLPAGVRALLRTTRDGLAFLRRRWTLARIREQHFAKMNEGTARFLGYTVRFTDGPNFYMQYKDEFVRRSYHFDAQRPDPLIIDGGSNIGMSILYFKHVYPKARIIGFEPDPAIFELLNDNVTRNGLRDVHLVPAGLGAKAGTANFSPDGTAGGQVGSGTMSVRLDQLSSYLDQPVDFLKLNIEGQELPVLQEVEESGRLRNVRELVIEYHGWPGSSQLLGPLLDLLERQGFRYLVHDLDEETNPATKPPFSVSSETTWFCLVYGKRL